MSERQVGEVVTYNREKGWGFIRPLQQQIHCSDFFFNIGVVQNRIALAVGDIVSFCAIPSKKKPGREDATEVKLHKRDEAPVGPAVASAKGSL